MRLRVLISSLLFALGTGLTAAAQSTATLSGSIKDIFSAADTSQQVCLTLRDTKADKSGSYQTPVNPRVAGVGSLPLSAVTTCKDATGGAYSLTVYANDIITTQNGQATVWAVTIKSKRGGEVTVGTYRFLAGLTYDLSTATPLNTPPAVTPPTGDTTYARLDTGNMPFQGAVSIKGISNGVDLFSVTRQTDTLPTGNFVNYKSAAGVSLFKVDVSGNATAISLTTAGNANLCKVNGIRLVDFANTCGWAGTDIGAWVNAAAADVVKGEVYIEAGSYTWSTAFNLDGLTGIVIRGAGGLTAGSASATSLTWTGTNIPVSARSSLNIHITGIQFLWNNAAFAGPVVDTSHSGLATDTSGFELDHCSFFKTGSGVVVPLISLDKTINSSIHNNVLHTFTIYAIRGAAGSGSYANVIQVYLNQANSSTGDSSGSFILNPLQSWTVWGNTVELGNAVGVVQFATNVAGVTTSNFVANGANWMGDANAGQAYTMFDFSAGGAGAINISSNFMALTATSSYVKMPNNSQLVFKANSIGACSSLFDNSAGTNIQIDMGAGSNTFTGGCATFFGTNNPGLGYVVDTSGNPRIFGTLFTLPPLRAASNGSLSTPAYSFLSSTSSGWFWDSSGRIQYSHGGTAGPMLDNNGWINGSGMGYRFANNVDPNAAGSFDTGIGRGAAGVVTADTTTIGNGLGKYQAAGYNTTTNCASSSGTCTAAPAGRVSIAAAATTVTVATTAITANSEIFIQEDSTLGSALGVTCNTTTGRIYTVTIRTAGTSFVITASAAPTTNPACLSYHIIN